ncbi:MAG: sarcosine oxidase subunit beta [Hyphomicrobiales bacterium]|nr:MAG: sarcosine oxidase subunit beta [Hyphomicrobiales bacterium]
MSSRFNVFNLLREGLRGQTGWQAQWREPELKASYDAVIIGGGGHGLATAYYLAKEHGMRNIAVIEKGWIGGGNSGRNTTIIRSNYLYDASAAIYNHALSLWTTLGRELNYNIMMSHRGVLNLAHDEGEARTLKRRVEANRLNGVDAEWLDAKQVKAFCPPMSIDEGARYPVIGATLQRTGGTNRHDAVVWGFARAASAMGVDIIQQCEVTGIKKKSGKIVGLHTTKGDINTPKIGSVAAGHTSVVANMVGLKLPIESHPLQALVSEPLKPLIPCVVMSNAVHVYVSQSDKGELVIGAGIDPYVSYTQRGSFDIIEHQMASLTELFPMFSRLRMMRQWGGIVDVSPDASPILSRTPIDGFYVNGGWGTGGWKATPASGHAFADLIAKDQPNEIARPFSLERFTTGNLVAEHGAAAVAH